MQLQESTSRKLLMHLNLHKLNIRKKSNDSTIELFFFLFNYLIIFKYMKIKVNVNFDLKNVCRQSDFRKMKLSFHADKHERKESLHGDYLTAREPLNSFVSFRDEAEIRNDSLFAKHKTHAACIVNERATYRDESMHILIKRYIFSRWRPIRPA